jgi:hypothetical protein
MPPLLIPERLRFSRTAVYTVLFVAAFIPIVDLVATALPLSPRSVLWRFGAVGLAATALGTALVVSTMIYLIAAVTAHRGMLLTIMILTAFAGLITLVGAGSFVLDSIQMRPNVKPEAAAKFWTASGIALYKARAGVKVESDKAPTAAGSIALGRFSKPAVKGVDATVVETK